MLYLWYIVLTAPETLMQTICRYSRKLAEYAFWCLMLSVILVSCTEKKADPGKYTTDFLPIFNQVNKLLDKQPTQGLAYLDSAFKTLPNPSIHDRFRFYSLHFIIEKKSGAITKKHPYTPTV